MLGWHFMADDGRVSRYVNGLGEPQPNAGVMVAPGQTLRVCGLIARGSVPADPTFARGLFASVTPAEALFHARGLLVCRVRLSGQMLSFPHYAQAEERTCLWMARADTAVWEWGVWCAGRAIRRARAEGHCIEPAWEQALVARRNWLHGKATLADVDAQRAPALQAFRRACGMNASGKPDFHAKASLAVQHAARLAYALTRRPQHCDGLAARRPGYYDTPDGVAENEALETLLLRLAPQGQG